MDNLDEWAKQQGLSPAAIDQLKHHGFETVDDVLTIGPEDLNELGLKLADKSKLRKSLQPQWRESQISTYGEYRDSPSRGSRVPSHYDGGNRDSSNYLGPVYHSQQLNTGAGDGYYGHPQMDAGAMRQLPGGYPTNAWQSGAGSARVSQVDVQLASNMRASQVPYQTQDESCTHLASQLSDALKKRQSDRDEARSALAARGDQDSDDDEDDGNFTDYDDLSDEDCITDSAALEAVKEGCLLVARGPPVQYQLPVDEVSRCVELDVRRVTYGKKPVRLIEKSILMIGETGSGKSTMIDALINHVMGIDVNDDFRFRIISTMGEDAPVKKTSTESQTDWVTCYTVYPTAASKVDFTLNIIDTPGFGDTRGMDRDQTIVQQIKQLFSSRKDFGVDYLNAACFVVKATNNRLTVSQRYVMDSVLGIFGKDVKDNICVMCSFSDGENPPVLKALKMGNMPFKHHFDFNNGWLNGTATGFNKHYAQVGNESFDEFTQFLKSTQACSLKMSTQVLQEREELERTVEGLQELIRATTGKLCTVRATQDMIKRHGDTSFKVPVTKRMKKITPDKNRSCNNCKVTCKQNVDRLDIFITKIKSKKTKCKVCECEMQDHVTQKWRYDIIEVMEARTMDQLQTLYGDGEQYSFPALLSQMDKEAQELIDKVNEVMTKMRSSLKLLAQIALRPELTTTSDYLDVVIKKEEEEKRPGFERRIYMMNKLREQNKLIFGVKGNQDANALLEDYI